jgi:hypothetical protein
MPVIARRERELDSHRELLEADLVQTGWRQLNPGPKWLERGDKVFEKGGRRILVDAIGTFVYKQDLYYLWKRHRGGVGFDRGVILDLFERKGYRE